MNRYVVETSKCPTFAEFGVDGGFVALHRLTDQVLFQWYAELFSKNHCGQSFIEIEKALQLNGDKLTSRIYVGTRKN